MYRFYRALQIKSGFSEKTANVTHLRNSLRTCVVPKNLWDRSCGYGGAVRIDLEDYFGQKWSQTMSGLHINWNCMLVDLSETNSVIGIFSRYVLSCCDL